ncbi:MAG: class A beta-lactamase, partial [Sphingobacterium sp.]
MHYLLKIASILLFFPLGINSVLAQTKAELKNQIEDIIAKYDATVGVAVHSNDFTDSLIINGEKHYPLQSVYKVHLGIVVLDQIDKGKLKLDQVIDITKQHVNTDIYSPIRDKYPNGTSMSIGKIIKYSIAQSDNVACDVLFELLGGPDFVQQYFINHNYENLSIKWTEEIQQHNWDLQFENWTTVSSVNRILFDYYQNTDKLLSDESHLFLWNTMRETQTGQNQLKANLPKGTVIAHKTGFSGQHKETGEIAAMNNVGVITLPNGEVFYISVFVTESQE